MVRVPQLIHSRESFDETVIRSDSALTVDVSRYVKVNFKVEVVDDETASAETQIRQSLAAGLTYTFL